MCLVNSRLCKVGGDYFPLISLQIRHSSSVIYTELAEGSNLSPDIWEGAGKGQAQVRGLCALVASLGTPLRYSVLFGVTAIHGLL